MSTHPDSEHHRDPVPGTKLRLLVMVIVGVLAVIAASCGGDDDTDDGAAGGDADFKACQVSDTGGIDDKSFNETA